jgi:uncharacterized membrane protein
MIADPFLLLLVFFGIVLLAVFLDNKFVIARKLSPVLIILFVGALVSNVGLITDSSPFYDRLVGYTVPFAVCIVLFRVNLGDFKRTGLPLLVAFFIACVGTFVGALAASLALETFLRDILGGASWKLAGPFTGTYIGGSLNFIALWEGLGIGSKDLFAAANAVDNLTLFPLFAIWIFLPDLLERFYPVAKVWKESGVGPAEKAEAKKVTSFNMLHIVTLIFLALVIMAVSEWLNVQFFSRIIPQLPTILIITTFALILAQLKFVARLEGAMELGNLSFYLFFCAVGAMMNIAKAVLLSPVLFVYVAIMIVVHMVIVYGVGRLLRLDIKILTIASSATKSGPPTVLALANVKGWKTLALPGIALGLLGYAVGNYAGFAAAYVVKWIIGA